MSDGVGRALSVICLLALAAAPAIAGESFHDSICGWRVTVPGGWRSVPVDTMNALLGDGGDVNYRAAFVGTPDGSVGHPFVAVQFLPVALEGRTLEEIEWQFEKDALRTLPPRLRDSLVEISRRAKAAGKMKVCFDPLRCRLATYNKRDFPVVGSCQGLAISYFVPDGLIQLNFWDRDAAYSGNLPAFEAMVRSFEFDEGREWGPAAEHAAAAGGGAGGLPIGLIAGVGGAVIALIVLLLVVASRRSREARAYRGRGAPPTSAGGRGRRTPPRRPGRRGRGSP